ncbi:MULTISPECIES: thioredoxin family protein [Hyphobacterium]|uniref:Thioredoxin family protein n=1 Tax=Hyphobacterium vulgare TaxID=1736751 RepID=A0ABV6ZZ97_9PROT
MFRAFALIFLLILSGQTLADDDIRPFDETADASAAVDAALDRARAAGHRVIVVLGGNWCHDSIGFASHMASEAMQPVLERYELVYVDVGMRNRHQEIPVRFGVPVIYATPTILVVDPELGLVNGPSVHDWGNAYSRPTSDAVEYFTSHASIRPGSAGLVENTATYQALVAEIDAWEAREGARLMRAYREIETVRAEMADDFARAGNDDAATEAVEAFHAFEDDVERQRRRMRNDMDRLRGDARDDARSALLTFADGRALDSSVAADWDATEPEIALDLPVYGPLGPWEDGE